MLRDDLRDTIRLLRRRPGFTTLAILLLALGLGANALIFALADGLVLTPFPYRDPDRLVAIGVTFPRLAASERVVEALSAAEYTDIATAGTLHQVMAFDLGNRNLSAGGRAERVFTGKIWGNPFDTLGMPALHGRGFLPRRDARPAARRSPSSATASSSASSTPIRSSSAGPSASTASRRPSSASCRPGSC